jgi:hypothetical protein
VAWEIHGVVQYAQNHHGLAQQLEGEHMSGPADAILQWHTRESPPAMINPDVAPDPRRSSNPRSRRVRGEIRNRLFEQGPVPMLRLWAKTVAAGR